MYKSTIVVSTNTPLFTHDCSTSGFPRPQVYWSKVKGSSHRLFSVGSRLRIRNTQKSDSGTYRCFASNAAGKASVSVSIEVKGMELLYYLSIYSLKPTSLELSISVLKSLKVWLSVTWISSFARMTVVEADFHEGGKLCSEFAAKLN